ncbi:MAG TPA: biotin/lipoyl-binding protein, partial [Polyangiales bacterium]|nr:biotin/lipoyl-binding protein [Polyangiales bacterium]
MDAAVEDAAVGQGNEQQRGAAAAATRAEQRRARLRWTLMMGGLIVALIGALLYYLFTGRYESTDDSSVMAAQTSISANIAGRVVELDVRDNQLVHRGDVLFRLDERPLRIAVEEAQAKLAA